MSDGHSRIVNPYICVQVTITHVLTEQGHEFRADRKNSPPFQFEPLSPSPRPRTARPMPQRTPSPSDDDNEARTYPFVLRKPFKDPYEYVILGIGIHSSVNGE